MKVFTDLFFSFLKVGLFTFGGGYAMLPILKDEVVIKRKWITEDELLNYFSIGQCTPGIIAINVATFCGYKLKKTIGAVIATLAIILPSLVIIMLAASVLKEVMHHPVALHILGGVRIGVTALLLKVVAEMGYRIYKDSQCKILTSIIFILAAFSLLFWHVSALIIVLYALAFGIADLFKGRLVK